MNEKDLIYEAIREAIASLEYKLDGPEQDYSDEDRARMWRQLDAFRSLVPATRYALVAANASATEAIAAYLPDNYRVIGRTPIRGTNTVQILIGGSDVAGWTLDDYVIPRLASGMFWAEEVA